MDIKKLMVGNWVMYNPNIFIEDEYEPAQSKYATKITNVEDIDLAVEGCYEPIPLTEEFFEKNGFVLNNSFYPYYKKYENEDKRIIITNETNSGDGYWYVHVDNEDFDSIGGCDVKYVHQFQQLLRLCGYEMEVVM